MRKKITFLIILAAVLLAGSFLAVSFFNSQFGFAQTVTVHLNASPQCAESAALVDLTWNMTGGTASSHTVFRKTGEGTYQEIYTGLNTAFTDTVQSDQNYTYQVRSLVDGVFYYSQERAISATYCPPALYVSSDCNNGNALVRINWNSGLGGSTAFYILKKEPSDTDFVQINSTALTDGDKPYIDNNVLSDTTYIYKLKAEKSGLTYFSQEKTALPAYCPVLLNSAETECQDAGPKINISWVSASGSVSKYEVFRDGVKIGETQNNSFQDSGSLVGEQYYDYSVKTIWQSGGSAVSDVIPVLAPACPPFLNELSPTCLNEFPGGPQINLSWNNLLGVVSYQIFRKTSQDSDFTFLAQVSEPSFSDNLVQSLPQFYWQNLNLVYKVKAIFQSSAWYDSNIREISIPQCAPFLTVQAICDETALLNPEFHLSWTATKGASVYNVYRDDNFLVQISDTSYTNYLSEDSCPGKICSKTYRAEAVAVGGNLSSESKTQAIDCATVQPPSPAPVLQEPQAYCLNGDSQISLSWPFPATQNLVYYSLIRNGQALVNLLNTSFIDSGVQSYQAYVYYLIAYGNAGLSIISENIKTIEAVSCVSPTTPVLTLGVDCENGRPLINLSWSESANTLKYEVYRGLSAGNLQLLMTFVQSSPEYVARTWQDKNLSFNTRYYYRIVAVGPAGVAPAASDIKNVITGNCYPTTPSSLTLSPACSNNNSVVNVSWVSDEKNTTRYEIFRDGQLAQTITSPSIKTWQDLNVSAYVNYAYRVDAIGFLPNQRRTSAVQAVTALYCLPPGNFTLQESSQTCKGSYPEIPLSWGQSQEAIDYSLFKRKLDINNNVLSTVSTPNATSPFLERGFGKALQFDGYYDYSLVSHNPILNSTRLTMESWVYPTSFYYYDYILEKYYGRTLGDPGYLLRFYSNTGRVEAYFWVNGGWRYCTTDAGVQAQINKWNHIVATYDGSNIKIYINNVGKICPPYSGAISTTGNSPLKFGSYYTSASNYYRLRGMLDEVRLYDRAISVGEVAGHYQGIFNNESGLIGLWHFDEGAGQTISNRANSITPVTGYLGGFAAVETADPVWVSNGLQTGERFDWQVQANNSGGSTLSNIINPINITACPPVKPGLAPEPICQGTQARNRISWSYSLGANSFEIFRDNPTPVKIVTGSDPEFSQRQWIDDNAGTGFPYQTNYTYWIKAKNSLGMETESDHIDISSQNCSLLPPPQNLVLTFQCSASSYPQVVLNWQAPIGSVVNYYFVWRSLNGTSWTPIATNIASTTLTYTDTSVLVAVRYYYRIEAKGPSGNSFSSNQDLTTNYCPPTQQTIRFLSTFCENQKPVNKVVWNDPTPFNSSLYEFDRNPAASSPIASFTSANPEFSQRYWFDNNELANLTNYIYKVKATGPAGSGVWSPVQSITTYSCGVQPQAPVLALNNVTCSNNISNVSLSWGNIANTYSYNLHRLNPDNSSSIYSTVKSPFIDKGDYALGDFYNLAGNVNLGDAAAFKITGDLTIEFWAKPFNIASPSRQNPLCRYYTREFCLTMEPNGSLSYYHGNGSSYMGFGSPVMFSNNTWSHIVISRDVATRTMRAYKNGVFVKSGSWTSSYDPSAGSNALTIGAGYVNRFNGLIDEVRLYARALSAQEIQEHYQGIFKNETELRGAWHFNESGGASVFDSSPYDNTGSIANTLWALPSGKPGYITHPYSSADYKYQVKALGADTESGLSNTVSVPTLGCLNLNLDAVEDCTCYNSPVSILGFENKANVSEFSIYKNSNLLTSFTPSSLMSANGFLRHWLLLGSFDNTGCLGFDTDYLDSEIFSKPRAGSIVNGKTWFDYYSSTDYINLANIFSPNTNKIAYAFSYIYSAQAKDVKLRIGSDDGFKVFLNGANIFNRHVHRSAAYDQDSINIHLNQGLNVLLIKIEQAAGSWGFYARITETTNTNNALTHLVWWDSQNSNNQANSYSLIAKIGQESSSPAVKNTQALFCIPQTPVLSAVPQCQDTNPQVQISWSPDVYNQTLYWTLWRIRQGVPPDSWTRDKTITSFLDDGVESGQTYQYYLEAMSYNTNVSSNVVQIDALTCEPVPSQPIISSIIPKCYDYDSRIQISWASDSQGNTIAYNIWRASSEEGEFIKIYSNLPSTAVKYIDPVPADTPYYYKIEALGSGQDNTVFSLAQGATSLDCLNIPPSLSVLALSSKYVSPIFCEILINWTDAGNEDNYKVFRRLQGEQSFAQLNNSWTKKIIRALKGLIKPLFVFADYDNPLAVLDKNVFIYEDSLVEDGKTYEYQIGASNAKGTTFSNIITVDLPIASPGAFALSGNWVMGGKNYLTWTAPTFTQAGGPPKFDVYRDTTIAFSNPVLVCSNVDCINESDPPASVCNCYDNHPLMRYKFYKAVAKNNSLNTTESNIILINIPGPGFREETP